MRLKICLIVLFSIMPALSWATTVQVSFSGSITRIFYAACTSFENGSCNAWDNSDIASSTFYDGHPIALGQKFGGTLAYEATTPLSGISDDGHQAVYLNGVTSYDLHSGSMRLPATDTPRAGDGSFSVINDRNGLDSFYVSQWFSGPEFFATSDIHLFSDAGYVYSDFSVPTEFDVSNFDTLYYHLSFLRRADGDQLHAYGNLSDFRVLVVGVPEPSTLYTFFGGALLVFAIAEARRRRGRVAQRAGKSAGA